MDAFWNFVAGYWWLALVFGGAISAAIGSASKSIERSNKRRHKRKIETIKAKAELHAAKRGEVLSVEQTKADKRSLLQRLFDEHDEINAKWLDYELDVSKLIAYPAMSDGRNELTGAFLRAKKIADALRPASADAPVSEQDIAAYLDAVGTYSVAFDVAEKEAKRVRNTAFSEDERKRLDRAQQLLSVAVDKSATQAERNVAYKRVREELDGLIQLSDAAVDVLEKKVARELEQ